MEEYGDFGEKEQYPYDAQAKADFLKRLQVNNEQERLKSDLSGLETPKEDIAPIQEAPKTQTAATDNRASNAAALQMATSAGSGDPMASATATGASIGFMAGGTPMGAAIGAGVGATYGVFAQHAATKRKEREMQYQAEVAKIAQAKDDLRKQQQDYENAYAFIGRIYTGYAA